MVAMKEFLNQFSGTSMADYASWYASLTKPFFAPEPWVFGLAWGIVYPLIALALVWSLYLYFKKRIPLRFLMLFGLNMLLNLTFTPVLFLTRDNSIISLHILAVLTTLALLQVWAWKKSGVIFMLLVPYLLWGTFATVLQLTITALN